MVSSSLFVRTIKLYGRTIKRLIENKPLREFLPYAKRPPRYEKFFPGIQLAMPSAMTSEGWDRRTRFFKYRYPVRFFITETVPSFVRTRLYVYKQKWKFRNSNKIIFDDLKPGHWHSEKEYFLRLAYKGLEKRNPLQMTEEEQAFFVWWKYYRPLREEYIAATDHTYVDMGVRNGVTVFGDPSEVFGQEEDRMMLKRFIDMLYDE